MNIERLKWDSDFFELNIGKIDFFEDSFFEPENFIKKVKEQIFDIVYVFKYQSILAHEDQLRAGLELTDIQLTMSKKFNPNDYLNIPYDLRTELSQKELNECYAITETISHVSRFFKEKNIGPNKTKELYRKWIDNAVNQTNSDGLFLVKEQGKIVGIHVIKTNKKEKNGYCSLIGVDPNLKGKRIGTMLWNQAFSYWANQCEVEMCKVPFSLQNKESFNFHLKMGFNKIEEIKYIYHYRK